MDPLQLPASNQGNRPPDGDESNPGHVTAFASTANLRDELTANPWATTPTPAAPGAPAPQALAVEQGGSAGGQLDAPGNAERRSASASSHPGAPMFAAVSRDHQGVVPVLEGEVSGAGASEQIANGFEGNKHFERNGGQVQSTDNNGIITASENSGNIALTRNRNALTITNNDGTVTSQQAQKGAIEHIETNSGLYHVSEQSNARHNIVNNRQTVQIGDRNGGGLGADGLVRVSGHGKVEFWHPNAREPEIHHLNGNTLTFTQRGLPNVLEKTLNWAANNPGKAGIAGAVAAGVGAAGTGGVWLNNAAAAGPSIDAAHKLVQGGLSGAASAASATTTTGLTHTAKVAATEGAEAAKTAGRFMLSK